MAFLIVAIVLFNATAFKMPKRLTRVEIYSTCLFASVLQMVVDMYLDVKYDLYGYFSHGVDWLSLVLMVGLYPSASTVFLNYYPFSQSRWVQFIYVMFATGLCLLFELTSLAMGYFYYNGWRFWYSAVAYPLLLWVLAQNLRLLRRLG